jgi:DNA-binding response OmpR family regulator
MHILAEAPACAEALAFAPEWTKEWGMKLLIVEENAAMRRLIVLLIQELNVEISECDDGAKALEAFAEAQPDLVLLDLDLAQTDSLTVTRQIKSAYQQARVIIMADDDDERLRAAAQSAGASDYALKENLLDLRQILQTQ